jgi:sporulation protein YlmC with PRC-barrel domain
MSSNSNDYSHYKELGNSKYQVAQGESDIRSWIVKNEKGNILGEVLDLILDTKSRKVQFIVLDLNRNELNLKERKVLLPLEYADIHESYKNVIYKGLMPNELSALPTYEKGNINRNSMDLTMSTFIASVSNDHDSTQRSSNYASNSPDRNEHGGQPTDFDAQPRRVDFNSPEREK